MGLTEEVSMNVSDFYQNESRWLKAEDLKGRKHKVIIDKLEVVEFKEKSGQNQKKIGLLLQGRQKGLMLNKTNAKIIATQHGDNMEAWEGKEISIYPTQTDFGGEMVDCIRVELPIPAAADDGDEIPF